jgi:hypothetical protein
MAQVSPRWPWRKAREHALAMLSVISRKMAWIPKIAGTAFPDT